MGAWPPATLALVGLLSLACSPPSERGRTTARAEETTQGAAGGPTVHRDRVRGVIEKIPGPASASRQIFIHHEEIAGFVGPTGEVEKMQAMTMPFTAAEGLDLSGLEEGDKIAFELEVDWRTSRPGVVTSLEKHPPETELAFEPSDDLP